MKRMPLTILIIAVLLILGYIVYAKWTCSGPLFSHIYWDGTNVKTGEETGGRYCKFVGFSYLGEKMFRTDSDITKRLESDVGKVVTYSGFARDNKAGATLSIEGVMGAVIYIDGLSAWPKEYLGQRIEVTGTLTYKKYIPNPTNNDGLVSQGAEGRQYVLESAIWKLK